MAQEADLPSGARTRARARLEAAMDERKRSFLRMVSHELRTPLNSILGFSEILTSELYGPLGASQYKEYAEIIHGSGQKLLKLVNQVLEIARLEGGAIEFDPAPESLESALDDVLANLKPELASRGVTVSVTDQEALPHVMADHRGLRTLLMQLLHNAIVFSPDGGDVTVAAVRAGDTVEITIRDQGEGVDAAELNRLMAPFEQGENALTRKSEGAGLGLPIAELTCIAMGGRLSLASVAGEGLTATARLPAAD
ncbi:MAG: histidine kinase [Phenylobacterium sp. SCN 70-31]|nr:MAG: histidine kinase [Phenylobacterium sp. SCN 70-31]